MILPEGYELLASIKGAPNYVLDACTEVMSPDGTVQPLTSTLRAETLSMVDKFSSQALRVLAVAVRSMNSLPFDVDDEDCTADDKMAAVCTGLTLVGLVASVDPAREGVREAVCAAREGHIRVVMITGDYLRTAAAIGRNVAILADSDDEKVAALDCAALRPNDKYLPDAELDALTTRVNVFARARPEDKLQIVESLQRQGLVSAMTGDGVNDAPALKRADIGVAMGIQGTEVAKDASDMILMDDNFGSIVKAVEKGRVIYAGIQKFVAFIMSVHLAEVLQIFVCIAAKIPIMRTPLQILFLILVTDLPPSIALGMEPGQRGILKQRPRPKNQPIVRGWMWQGIAANALILSAVIIGVYLWALNHYVGELDGNEIMADVRAEEEIGSERTVDQLEKARTVAFISLVWSEAVRAYVSRSFNRPFFEDFLSNTQMQKEILVAQIALVVAVFLPGLSDAVLGLRGASIGLEGWGVAALGALATLILCEFYKFLSRGQIAQQQKQVQVKDEALDAKSAKELPSMCV